jgi:hypothetical protein
VNAKRDVDKAGPHTTVTVLDDRQVTHPAHSHIPKRDIVPIQALSIAAEPEPTTTVVVVVPGTVTVVPTVTVVGNNLPPSQTTFVVVPTYVTNPPAQTIAVVPSYVNNNLARAETAVVARTYVSNNLPPKKRLAVVPPRRGPVLPLTYNITAVTVAQDTSLVPTDKPTRTGGVVVVPLSARTKTYEGNFPYWTITPMGPPRNKMVMTKVDRRQEASPPTPSSSSTVSGSQQQQQNGTKPLRCYEWPKRPESPPTAICEPPVDETRIGKTESFFAVGRYARYLCRPDMAGYICAEEEGVDPERMCMRSSLRALIPRMSMREYSVG